MPKTYELRDEGGELLHTVIISDRRMTADGSFEQVNHAAELARQIQQGRAPAGDYQSTKSDRERLTAIEQRINQAGI